MYDWPELVWATDALWRAIAERLSAVGIAAPPALDRSRPVEDVWCDPGLVLSQTCGFPFATRLRGSVRLVATPVYLAEGCAGALYSSIIVAAQEEPRQALADFAGCRVAFNASDSLSGHVALVAAMREAGLAPGDVEWIETGSHRASLRAVATEQADLAAIDAVCWSLAARFEKAAISRLRRIGATPLRPALPFITAGGRSDAEVGAIRAALAAALADRETVEARRALGLADVAVLEADDYAPLSGLLN